MIVSEQLHASVALLRLGEKLLVPIDQGPCWVPTAGLSAQKRKISPLPWIEPKFLERLVRNLISIQTTLCWLFRKPVEHKIVMK